jgi:hypothetical protein
MELHTDFKDLLACLIKREAEFLVVGGYALAAHGAPRSTGDLDLFVRPTPENAHRVLAALEDFGFGSLGVTTDDLVRPDQVIQLGYPPVRVDLLTSLTGVSWQEAEVDSVQVRIGDLPIRIIGYQALLKNKRATGRKRDLADLEALGEE